MMADAESLPDYDINQFIPPPSEELICAVCQNVLWEPRECPCQHVFCKLCITTWFKHQNMCPICRHPARTRHLKPVLPLLQNLILKLCLTCKYAKRGCPEKVTLEAYSNHVKRCDYEVVECGNVGCKLQVLKREKKEHSLSCQHRLVPCSHWCGFDVPFIQTRNHECKDAVLDRLKELNDDKLLQDRRISELTFTNDRLVAENTSLQSQLNELETQQEVRHTYYSEDSSSSVVNEVPSDGYHLEEDVSDTEDYYYETNPDPRDNSYDEDNYNDETGENGEEQGVQPDEDHQRYDEDESDPERYDADQRDDDHYDSHHSVDLRLNDHYKYSGDGGNDSQVSISFHLNRSQTQNIDENTHPYINPESATQRDSARNNVSGVDVPLGASGILSNTTTNSSLGHPWFDHRSTGAGESMERPDHSSMRQTHKTPSSNEASMHHYSGSIHKPNDYHKHGADMESRRIGNNSASSSRKRHFSAEPSSPHKKPCLRRTQATHVGSHQGVSPNDKHHLRPGETRSSQRSGRTPAMSSLIESGSSSDDTEEWEWEAFNMSSSDSLTEEEDEASDAHHLYIPKTAGQLLAEYDSCDSDDSWHP